MVADSSLSGRWVARELDQITEYRVRPFRIVSENGTELTSHAILRWQEERGVDWQYVKPGKPIQSASAESLNAASGSVHECHRFLALADDEDRPWRVRP